MKNVLRITSNRRRNLSLSLFFAITVTVIPQGASAYVPKIVHDEDKATSIDGELYEDSEIMSCRTPVRYYYYKVIEEDAVDNKDCRILAEKWGDESLPSPDAIRGLVKKVKVANDEVTKKIQRKFCEMLKDGRDDIIAAYAEALRLNGELKGLAAAVVCYKKCLSSPKWKGLAEREPRKRKDAFTAIKKLVVRPSGEILLLTREGVSFQTAERMGLSLMIGSELFDYYGSVWAVGELQQKIDECYYELIDLKKAKIAADNQRMDASSPNAPDLRKMRAMAAQTKKNVRVTKRMAKKAENAADAAAASADSAAASASSAAGSAASAADSAARAARSADAARFGF